MNAKWILAALCAASVTNLTAQEEGSTRARIREEVAEKQRLMREGKIVHSNVRVTVRLMNGSRLIGVVKNGRFIERHDGLAFVSGDRVAKDSGLRLWYYDQTNSFIFLPWDTISEHSIGEILSDEEVTRMGIEFDRTARDAKPKSAPTSPETRGEVKPGTEATESKTDKPATSPAAEKASTLTAEEKALLAEFPPDAGWGEQRRRDIELRKIQIHVYPDEREQRFLDNFAAWSAAYDKQQAEEAAARVQGPGAAPPGGVASPAGGETVTTTSAGKSTKPAAGTTDPARTKRR